MTTDVCVVPACGALTTEAEYGVAAVDPAARAVCLEHYKALLEARSEAAERAANAAAALAHAAAMAALPRATCYGDAGACPNFGALYPGGPYCVEHAPSSLPPLHASFILEPAHAAPAVEAPSREDEIEHAWMAGVKPLLSAVDCPEVQMPGSVKSAVKKATANAWAHTVTLAVGPAPEAITSVVFSACKDGTRVGSRHEQAQGRPMGFKAAFASINNRMPLAIGFRELTAILDGADLMERDRQEMKDAVFLLFDSGAEIVSVTSHA